MDRSRKKGQRGPTRKKRLQIDLGKQSAITTEAVDDSRPPPQITNNETQLNDAAASTSTHHGNDDASISRPKSASPEPNCAICLGKLENKSFTDSCFHMFCFVCLEEWSKVKAECPLCKQTFKSIIHNVRSLDDYDQYQVQRPPPTTGIAAFDIHADAWNGQRFRYRTTVTDHRYAFAHLWERERQSRLLQRPSRHVPIPNLRRMRQPANSEFRRSIYEQKLKVKQDHQVNTRRRVRETSPTFFRDNPAQTHRLVPWLNRELNALLEGHGSQVAFVLELIMGLIKRFPIDSDEVYEHLYPFIGRRTRQFMEEFLQFAKSPHMMAAYDRHVTYEPQETSLNHDSESDSGVNANRDDEDDDGNDSDVIVVSPTSDQHGSSSPMYPGAPAHAQSSLDPWERSILTAGNPTYLGFPPISRSRAHNDLSEFQFDQPYSRLAPSTSTSTSGWDSPTPSTNAYSLIRFGDAGISGRLSPTNSRNSSAMLFDIIHEFNTPNTGPGFEFLNPGPSISAPPVVSNSQSEPISFLESDTDSHASDVMIVDYEKPWEERTPIRLSSAEESDFELMITGTTYITDPVKKEHKRKKRKKSQDDKKERNEKRKKSDEEEASTSGGKHHKKKRKKTSRSTSKSSSSTHKRLPEADIDSVNIRSRSRSRSFSQSPVSSTLQNYSNYLHKKYHYLHPESSISKRPGYEANPFRSLSVSSTDTVSDDESHISIRSRKEKSRSGHSSIEIVKYRKRSSKYKSGKKHSKSRSSDRERQSDTHNGHKQKKHKKDQKHKKTKKKSKSKKSRVHSKEDLDNLMRKYTYLDSSIKGAVGTIAHDSEEEIDPVSVIDKTEKNKSRTKKRKKQLPEGTSDSDLDSDTDHGLLNVDKDDEDSKSDDSLTDQASERTKKDGLNTLELVELSELESAAFDEELERITKNLPVIPSQQSSVINTAQVPPKIFKKHPHGHKKSSANSQGVIAGHTMAHSSVGSVENKSILYNNNDESNIQSSDITSCTDIESRINLLIKSQDNMEAGSSVDHLGRTGNHKMSIPNVSNSSFSKDISPNIYESPTSSGYRNIDIVDVETLSEGSDVDVTHVENAPHAEKAIDVEGISDTDSDSYIYANELNDTERGEKVDQLRNKEKHIDVVGSSDEHSDNENVVITGSTLKTSNSINQLCSKRVISNSDSDTTIDFNEDVEHENIDITGDSDSDVSQHLQVIDSESDADEINISDQENDDRKDKRELKSPIYSSSDEYEDEKQNEVQSEFQNNSIKTDHSSNDSNDFITESKEIGLDEAKEQSNYEYNEASDEGFRGNIILAEKEDSEDDKTVDISEEVMEENIHFAKETVDTIEDNVNAVGENNKVKENVDVVEKNKDNHFLNKDNQEIDSTPNSTIEKEQAITEGTSFENLSDVKKVTKPVPPQTSSYAGMTSLLPEESPQLSLNWTLNQTFESTSPSSSGVDDRRPSSPPYMATLYDRGTAELNLSPDFTFESLSQSSPGPLSPGSTSDNGTDNFVAED